MTCKKIKFKNQIQKSNQNMIKYTILGLLLVLLTGTSTLVAKTLLVLCALEWWFFPFSTTLKKNTLILAVDIEAIHVHSTVAPVAVGMVLGDTQGNILKSQSFHRRVNIPIDKEGNEGVPHDASVKCWKNFWLNDPKNMENLKAWNQRAGTVQEMGEAMTKWINAIETDYPLSTVKIVSDNPAFDIAAIDNVLFRTTGRIPMRYTTKEVYRSIDDPTEQMACLALPICKSISNAANQFSHHNHDPLSDAANIYSLWVNLQSFRDRCAPLPLNRLLQTVYERM
jgi:hypothetical protein